MASLPSFRSIQLLLAVPNFMLQMKNAANDTNDKCVRTFDARCRDTQSASDQLQLCELSGPTSRFTMQEFSMVGDYIVKIGE